MAGEPTEGGLAQKTAQLELNRQQAAGILDVPPDELEGWEVRYIEPETDLITAQVPLEQLNVDGFPVEDSNVDELVILMDQFAAKHGGTGQKEPGVVDHVPGEDFYVVDSFHRHHAHTIRQERDKDRPDLAPYRGKLLVIVHPNKEFTDVVADKIIYSKDHPGIKVARQVEQMQSDWDRSPWADKVKQVLTAIRSTSENYWHGASEEERELIESLDVETLKGIADWVDGRIKRWELTQDEILDGLEKTDGFARDLMPLIHVGKGQPPKGRIRLGTIEPIVEDYREQDELQTILVNVAIGEKLSKAETNQLVLALQDYHIEEEADMHAALASIDLDDIRTAARPKGGGSSTKKASGPAPTDDLGLLLVVRERIDGLRAAASAGTLNEAESEEVLQVVLGLASVALDHAQHQGGVETLDPQSKTTLGNLAVRFAKLSGMNNAQSRVSTAPSPEKPGPPEAGTALTRLTQVTESIFAPFLSGLNGHKLPRIERPEQLGILRNLAREEDRGWSPARVRQLEKAIADFSTDRYV